MAPRRCIAAPTLKPYPYTAIDEYARLRYLVAYPEQSTYSSADFIRNAIAWFKRRGIKIKCVQTGNGLAFPYFFSASKRDVPTLFEETLTTEGIRHKPIRPYTPRHNGKVERSRREDQKRLHDTHSFFSLAD